MKGARVYICRRHSLGVTYKILDKFVKAVEEAPHK